MVSLLVGFGGKFPPRGMRPAGEGGFPSLAAKHVEAVTDRDEWTVAVGDRS